MQVEELCGWVAEVRGVDCSQRFSPRDFEEVQEQFAAHPVMVFRDQSLTPKEQLSFSTQFGPLEEKIANRQYVHPDCPKVLILSNEINPDGSAVGVVDAGDDWHSDSSHQPAPAKMTILHAQKLPSSGGDTGYCNMYLAYESLRPELKERVRGLRCLHHISKLRNRRTKVSTKRPNAAADYARLDTDMGGVFQPIVRLHPDTNKPVLFVSPRFTIAIEGIDGDEGEAILDELIQAVEDERWHFTYKWQPGDLVMWDNRCLTHKALGGYELPDVRRMHRTVLAGEPAVAFPG